MADPKIRKCRRITGNRLLLVDAKASDAEFILELRSDVNKNRYLSPTSPDLEKQLAWMEKYRFDDSQAYFLILSEGERIGTVRLYDPRLDSFCWGSWLIKSAAPSSAAIESALMVYHYARSLGFSRAHFDVRKENLSVWRFHERFGAMRIRETELDYFYEISAENIEASIRRYKKFLPEGIGVDW